MWNPLRSSKRSADEEKDSDEWSVVSVETAGSTTEAFAKKLKIEGKKQEEDDACSGSFSIVSAAYSQKSTTEALARKLNVSEPRKMEGDFNIVNFSDADESWSFWKTQFQNTFHYRLPLRHREFGQFEFLKEEELAKCRENPWKLAFEELSNGVHVIKKCSPGMNDNMLTFEQLEDALAFLNQNPEGIEKLIFVHSGTHSLPDTLSIPADVQIIGAADSDDVPEAVVLTGHHKTVLDFDAGEKRAYLGYLTVKFEPNNVAEEDVYAVKICGEDVKPCIEYCNIQSKHREGAAILVKDNADPKISNCTISKTRTCGIVVTDYGLGEFENCEITENLRGISVRRHAEPVFRNCHISNHEGVGVRISDSAKGLFENCKIFANTGAGMKLKHNANPTVKNCEISKGQLCGIHVHQTATGIFTGNRIFSNQKSNVWITAGAQPVFRENSVFNGETSGICIHTGGGGLIENNDIFENKHSNVLIRDGSNPIIRGNRVRNGHAEGVHVHSGGRGLIEDNQIFGNTMAGVFVTTEAEPEIRKNKVFDGKQAGLSFVSFGSGKVTSNEIYGNRKNGIELQLGSDPEISKNTIRANRKGIVIFNSARGCILENEITDSTHAGVDLRADTEENFEKGSQKTDEFKKIVIMSNKIQRNGMGIRCDEMDIQEMNFSVFLNVITENFGPAITCDNAEFDADLAKNNTVGENQNAKNVNGEQKHPVYRCTQCSETQAICEKCALRCHKGHKILFMKNDATVECDCKNSSDGCCKKM